MDEISRVFISVDAQGRVTRCEGEYTLPADLAGWIMLEEGAPCDRLNLAQTHYFDGGLLTAEGLPRWKYADGICTLRTAEELAADAPAAAPPTLDERVSGCEEDIEQIAAGLEALA